MREFIKPDFQRCNLNISATLAEFLGVPNKNAVLPVLKEELEKQYKNVVFLCFDGLGIYPMQKNLERDDFLWKNFRQTLVSVFPSTTTNATMSLMTNRLPREHGWFGWSMHFEDLNRNVDIFTGRDSLTGEYVELMNAPLGRPDYYFDSANSAYVVSTVFPGYVQAAHPERNHTFRDMDEFFRILEKICRRQEKQFVYAYYPDPDNTMHQYGVSSKEAKRVIAGIPAW